MGAHRIHQQTALLKTHVPGRRADEPGHRVFFHVLAHVKPRELVAELHRELFGEFGFADTRGPRKQETPRRTFGLPQAGAGPFDRLRHEMDRLGLTKHDTLQGLLQRAQTFLVRRRGLTRGNPGHTRDHRFDVGSGDCRDDGVVRVRTTNTTDGTGLIDGVDGTVGQPVVAQVTRCQFRRGFQRRPLVHHLVVGLVSALEALKNPHGLVNGRLINRDALQPARERTVLFNQLELFERG